MTRISRRADDNDDELVHQVAALERTALAWERTGIGVGAVGALLLHVGEESVPALLLGVALLLTAFVIVLLLAPARYRAARAGVLARDSVVLPRVLLSLSIVVAVVGVVALGLLLGSDLG